MISTASRSVLPSAHSEARLALAMDPVHPNALKRACWIFSLRIRSWIFTRSPDAMLPATELAAWTMTINELMNLDEALNK